MAFEIWKNSTQLGQFALNIPLTLLGFVIAALRFVATHRAGRRPGLEDWMAALAALFCGMTTMSGVGAIIILNGRSIEVEIAESPADYRRMREWDMVSLYSYFMHTLTVKLSVLALYYRIFSVNRGFKISIYILGSIQTVLIIIFCVMQSQLCKPFERYFDRSVPGSCKDDGIVIIGGETPNSLIDFAMVLLAIIMIRSLQLSQHVKWRLYALFGVGSIVAIVGFIKIAVTYSTADIYAFSLLSILTGIQMFLSLLCCCLPVFHPLLPSMAFWSQLRSRVLTYATFGRFSWSRSNNERSKPSSNPELLEPRAFGPNQLWEHLGDSSSTQHLAWPGSAQYAGIHAVNDYPLKDVTVTVDKRQD